MDAYQIYQKAILTWGKTAQQMMVVEEMAELVKELMKNIRGSDNLDALADETADVEIMLEQLKLMYNMENKVAEHKEFKLHRLEQRLNDWNPK